MEKHLNVLFVADLNVYSKGKARARILSEMGANVCPVTHTPLGGEHQGHPDFSLWFRALCKLGVHADSEGANERIKRALNAFRPDLVWIEKGNMIRPATLRHLRAACPGAAIVSYSDDDMFLAHNRARRYARGLFLYDLVFTTKALNCNAEELPALGARRVVLVDKAFDPHQHRPITLTKEEKARLACDVGFIGTFEKERADSLLFLARSGVAVRVWGNGWEAFAGGHPNLRIERRAVVNTDRDLAYSKAICATKINLGFLRKLNRDTQTDRSVEIPACGGFLLAERSDDHRRLFAEDAEAAFFSSDEELLAKVRRYLADEERRRAVARAGLDRCRRSGYSEVDRMAFMVAESLGRTPRECGGGLAEPPQGGCRREGKLV